MDQKPIKGRARSTKSQPTNNQLRHNRKTTKTQPKTTEKRLNHTSKSQQNQPKRNQNRRTKQNKFIRTNLILNQTEPN